MPEARYVIRKHRRPWGTRYTWQLQSGNYEALCSSEPYNSLQSAQEGIDAHRSAAITAVVVDMTA